MLFFPRSAWAPPSTRPRVDLAKRERVVFHHTVMADPDPTPNLWESIPEMFDFMRRLQKARPDLIDDVPYQLVAFFRGRGLVVIEGLGLDRVGAHVGGKNTASLGVAFAGNFDGYEPPYDPDQALVFSEHVGELQRLMDWLYDAVGRDLPWEPHRKYKATACPGSYILRLMAEAELPF